MSNAHYVNNRILKINVGLLLSESIGYSRTTELDVPMPLRVAEDLTLDGLRGTLRLSRNSRGVLVESTLSTLLHTECARCLEDAVLPIDLEIQELFVYPAEAGVTYVVTDDGNIDLAPLIREEAIVDTPQVALCRPDCAGLCPNCGANLNEGPCDCEQPVDPRLAGLKELLDPPRRAANE